MVENEIVIENIIKKSFIDKRFQGIVFLYLVLLRRDQF